MSVKKVSKAFRERIVPNVQADPQIKFNDQNVFLSHNLHETKLLNFTNTMHNNFLKERSSNLIRTSKNVAKFSNKTVQKPVIPAQIQKNNQPKRPGFRYLKQPQQHINQQFVRNSTDQSQKNQPNKLNRIEQIVKTKRTTKTEIVNKILKQIEERINSSQKSSQSLTNKYKDRKKKRVEDCKVVKIPWKNNKGVQFCPEFSMIQKNMSVGPRDSLRQIYDNLL